MEVDKRAFPTVKNVYLYPNVNAFSSIMTYQTTALPLKSKLSSYIRNMMSL